MFSRARINWVGSYGTSPKISDEFSHVLNRAGWGFDHIAIDVASFAGAAARLTRDLAGHTRDRETVKVMHRQITNVLLRRLHPKKSLTFVLDGSEPLWKVERMRLYPSKKFSNKFYRSAASPMVYELESRLQSIVTELRSPPAECVVCGASTPGPAEAKLSAWLLDLATRTVHAARHPPGAASVTANDSLCLVGDSSLFLLGLGATPFYNITTLAFTQGELKSLSLADSLEWLQLDHLLSASAPAAATAATPAAAQRLAAARTDAVLLYLLAHGISSTDLGGLPVSFSDLMDAYAAESSGTTAAVPGDRGASPGNCFTSLLFQEYPLVAERLDTPSLRLRPAALARVLARALKRPLSAAPARASSSAANYLEVLLQSHAMLCSGEVPNLGWTPADNDSVPERLPTLTAEALLGHLKHLMSGAEGDAVELHASRDRSFALTGLETLLLTAQQPSDVEQITPMFLRGHALPASLAAQVKEERNVRTALARVRGLLRGVESTSSHDEDGKPRHPAVFYAPSHYLVRSPAHRGPPPGWSYHNINLGIKAEAMSIRYGINASDKAAHRVLLDSGRSRSNMLHTFNAAAERWDHVSCAALAPPPLRALTSLRVLTWNVQFNRHSGERTPLGREGINWCTTTRYRALAAVLEQSNADVMALQEVEPAWCTYLAALPWVRATYNMSCLASSHAIQPWGVLLLTRKTLPVVGCDHANIPAFAGHTSAMPEVTLSVGDGLAPLTISSVHLLAPYNQNNVSNRGVQLQNLVKHLRERRANADCIVLGDYNDTPATLFTIPAELGFRDAWELLHPNCNVPPRGGIAGGGSESRAEEAAERGYTIDGNASPYTARIIEPEFFGRADRVLFAGSYLQPIQAALVGTTSVRTVLAERGMPQTLVDQPTVAIPDYLFPSDHFGLSVEFHLL